MTNQERGKKHIEYWFKTALHDWQTAQSLWRSKRYDACLFFCHLICEKSLKALVVSKIKQDAPRLHDLVGLAQLTGIEFTTDQQEMLAKINNFNIASRYPADQLDFYKLATKSYAEKYYKFTGEFLKWATKNLR